MTMVQTDTDTLAEAEVQTGTLWGLTAEFSTPATAQMRAPLRHV